jgi:hypothetical protein
MVFIVSHVCAHTEVIVSKGRNKEWHLYTPGSHPIPLPVPRFTTNGEGATKIRDTENTQNNANARMLGG